MKKGITKNLFSKIFQKENCVVLSYLFYYSSNNICYIFIKRTRNNFINTRIFYIICKGNCMVEPPDIVAPGGARTDKLAMRKNTSHSF